jgi:autotransporter-associated beta strand protein
MRPLVLSRIFCALVITTLLLCGRPAAAQPLVRSWNVAGNGGWNQNGNWAPAIVPDGANIEADFRSQPKYSGAINITLSAPVTLNRMVFNSVNAYTITPQANQAITLTGFNDKGTNRPPRLIVEKGNSAKHTVATPLVLDIPNKSNLSVQVAGTSPIYPSLSLTGGISSIAGRINGIDKTGTGALLLGAANTYSGATGISNGTVIAAANGALGPGGAGGGTVQVQSGASLMIGYSGTLDYNTGQKVVLRGNGAVVDGNPIGALTTSVGAFATFNGPVTLATNAAVGAPSTGNNLDPQLNLTGVISGANNLNKVGGGVVQLATANTYTGKTDIQAGVLSVSANGALGKGDTIVEQGATLNFNQVNYIAGAGQAKAHVVLMGGLGSQDDGQIRAFGGNSAFNGTVTLAASSSIGVYDKSTVFDFQGTINETAKSNLTKLGPGTLVLERGSTYSGDTLIKRGTLEANNGQNGSATGSGNVTVSPGATLKATNGHIDGKVINMNMGNIQPMKGMGGGLLTIGGGLALAAASTYTWTLGVQVDGRSPLALAGTDFSQLRLQGGLLSLDPEAILSLNLTGPGTIPSLSDPFWSSEHEWDVIALDSPALNPSSLAFTDIENGNFAAGSFSTIVDDGQRGYGNAGDILLVWSPGQSSDTGGGPVGVTAVPEPASWCLFLIGSGIIGLGAWHRRRPGAARVPSLASGGLVS